jgi:hypothetical protein
MLLNISGQAGIVAGFATWAGFRRALIDLYRAWIRVLGGRDPLQRGRNRIPPVPRPERSQRRITLR